MPYCMVAGQVTAAERNGVNGNTETEISFLPHDSTEKEAAQRDYSVHYCHKRFGKLMSF